MSILIVTNICVSSMDPGTIIIPIRHMKLDAHHHQKEKITQTDHPFKKEPFHNWPLAILVLLVPTGAIDPLIITVVMSILAMDSIPMDTTLMVSILMDTTLMDTIFTGTILMVTIPMDTIPMDTTPMTMISLTMDLVTHLPIAKNSRVSIIGDMVHHMDTQGKEGQVKDSFLSTNDKSDMSTDSLH